MRVTPPTLRQNKNTVYRYFWHRYRNLRIKDLGEAQFCRDAGIPVVNANKFLQIYDVGQPDPPKPPIIINESRERVKHRDPPQNVPISIFTRLLGGMEQASVLTNSIVFPHLPQHLAEAVEADLSPDEEQQVLNCITEAFLLDSYQVRLKDVRSIADKRDRRTPPYGIPITRRCELLANNFLTSIQQKLSPDQVKDGVFLTDTSSQVTMDYGERQMTFVYDWANMSLRTKGLPPVLQADEVALLDGTEMPDLFPQSPFSMIQERVLPMAPSGHFCTTSQRFVPHTVFFVNPFHWPLEFKNEGYSIKTLLAAFAFSASYARQKYGQDLKGDLPEPFTLQFVHLSEHNSQVSVFQLNTLDLLGPRKNIFWSHPMTRYYDVCEFKCAKPHVEGVDTGLYKLMKALHTS